MKILHVSDLHLQHERLDWLAAHCVEYDLLVVAGDLLDAFSRTPMQEQAVAVGEWLISLRAPVCVVDGNHDFWTARGPIDMLADGGWLKMLGGRGNVVGAPGDVIEFGGCRIACNGCLRVPNLDDQVDVLVTHAPPAGCAVAGGAKGRDFGDQELWPAIADTPPRWILSGHIHAPHRLWCRWPPIDPMTTVLVPGCDESATVPAHWIIDTDTGTATHSNGILAPS